MELVDYSQRMRGIGGVHVETKTSEQGSRPEVEYYAKGLSPVIHQCQVIIWRLIAVNQGGESVKVRHVV